MYKFFVHAEGIDNNGVVTTYQKVIEVQNNNFDALLKKLKDDNHLAQVTIVNFRNLGKVETQPESEDEMAKKKTTAKKATAKKSTPKKTAKKTVTKKEI